MKILCKNSCVFENKHFSFIECNHSIRRTQRLTWGWRVLSCSLPSQWFSWRFPSWVPRLPGPPAGTCSIWYITHIYDITHITWYITHLIYIHQGLRRHKVTTCFPQAKPCHIIFLFWKCLSMTKILLTQGVIYSKKFKHVISITTTAQYIQWVNNIEQE